MATPEGTEAYWKMLYERQPVKAPLPWLMDWYYLRRTWPSVGSTGPRCGGTG